MNEVTKTKNLIYRILVFIKTPLKHILILILLNYNIKEMKKMLLMGYSGAGKTSMHSVIFANFPAKDTQKIGYTVERQEHKFKFMGTLTLNLWDCGGQDTFM